MKACGDDQQDVALNKGLNVLLDFEATASLCCCMPPKPNQKAGVWMALYAGWIGKTDKQHAHITHSECGLCECEVHAKGIGRHLQLAQIVIQGSRELSPHHVRIILVNKVNKLPLIKDLVKFNSSTKLIKPWHLF